MGRHSHGSNIVGYRLFASGQLLLTPASDEFVHRVTWADGIAVGWQRHADPSSPVRIDLDVRFGRPAVGGISTEALREQSESGWSVDEVAQTFDLKPQQVRWALAYENSLRAA